VNHSIVLLGSQGIGKDTILEPLKHAVGNWNFADVSPHDILSPYSGYLQSVVVRINEGRDLGDVNRYQFYERTKIMMAAPPDVLRVNEKYIRERAVFNCCGVIITTNTKDSLYLPPDDRRHYVAYSEATRADYDEDYWTQMWGYYAQGGLESVSAYLRSYDLSEFDAKAPPPKTEAFWEIAQNSASPESSEMNVVLAALGEPDAVTRDQIIARASDLNQIATFHDWLTDRRNQRQWPRVMDGAGYVPVRNPHADSGLWRVGGARVIVYAKKSLDSRGRIQAARALAGVGEEGNVVPITR